MQRPKTKLFLVTLEPIASRYTGSWYKNFPPAFEELGFAVTVLDGTPLTDTIKVGSFLDINSTIAYKNSQMGKIAGMFHRKEVPQGAHFYFMDIEFWGIESLRLMADMNNVKIHISGFLHAASYTVDDAFSIAAPYQRYTEVGWIAALDLVFVGSEYHKRALIDRRLTLPGLSDLSKKVIVTGNPLFQSDYPVYGLPKKNQIILPNRIDWGKRPDLSFAVAALFKAQRPDWNVVVTTGKETLSSDKQWLSDYAYWMQKLGVLEIKTNCTKEDYHKTLAESKLMMSFSIEENFGYCIAEAIIYNVLPILRSGLSHDEFSLPDACYFDDEDGALKTLLALTDLNNYKYKHRVTIEDTVNTLKHGSCKYLGYPGNNTSIREMAIEMKALI